jgi:dihydrofolate reductase
MTERKIITHIATSADGYIARLDGGVDWLNRPRTVGDYGMTDFFKSIDTVIWGRKTYDIAIGFGKKGGGMGKKIKSYVFTIRHPRKILKWRLSMNQSGTSPRDSGLNQAKTFG